LCGLTDLSYPGGLPLSETSIAKLCQQNEIAMQLALWRLECRKRKSLHGWPYLNGIADTSDKARESRLTVIGVLWTSLRDQDLP